MHVLQRAGIVRVYTVHVLFFPESCFPPTDKWTWSCPKVKGDLSPHLAAHGCAVIGRKVFVFGGMSPTTGASDCLYCLNTGEYSSCSCIEPRQ